MTLKTNESKIELNYLGGKDQEKLALIKNDNVEL